MTRREHAEAMKREAEFVLSTLRQRNGLESEEFVWESRLAFWVDESKDAAREEGAPE